MQTNNNACIIRFVGIKFVRALSYVRGILLTICRRGDAIKRKNNPVTIKPNLNSSFSGSSTCAYARKAATKAATLPIKARVSF